MIGGRLADRLGVKFTATAGLAGLCACLLLLRPAIQAGIAVEFVLLLTSAIAQLFFPAQQAGLASDFPRQRATVLAWNNSALFLGIMLGSLVGGQAMALAGFWADLALCALVAIGGCIGNAIALPDPPRPAEDRPAWFTMRW
jgi:predicted MFS family arabinose efflux permease